MYVADKLRNHLTNHHDTSRIEHVAGSAATHQLLKHLVDHNEMWHI